VTAPAVLAIVVFAGAALAAVDLQREQARTLVVYTTAALQGLLENDVIPRFEAETGLRVEPVYVPAGEQYNRLRMSGATPEADVFLHASPLFIEKGYRGGYFETFDVPEAAHLDDSYRSRAVDGGHVWYAFAWSPLVEVYGPRFPETPDLATADVKFGLAHPLLSNNGVYNVLYFESLDHEAGMRAIARTTVQPVNARSSINGVADGSFDVTLGYEAVSLLYQAKGAKVASALPDLHGNHSVVPVLVSAGLVKAHQHPDAIRFLRFLFSDETQSGLAKSYYRPVLGDGVPEGGVDVAGLDAVRFDWSKWSELEAKLKDYEVRT
jgi:ABC-type molybdate transport system substrate-binding protein